MREALPLIIAAISFVNPERGLRKDLCQSNFLKFGEGHIIFTKLRSLNGMPIICHRGDQGSLLLILFHYICSKYINMDWKPTIVVDHKAIQIRELH